MDQHEGWRTSLINSLPGGYFLDGGHFDEGDIDTACQRIMDKHTGEIPFVVCEILTSPSTGDKTLRLQGNGIVTDLPYDPANDIVTLPDGTTENAMQAVGDYANRLAAAEADAAIHSRGNLNARTIDSSCQDIMSQHPGELPLVMCGIMTNPTTGAEMLRLQGNGIVTDLPYEPATNTVTLPDGTTENAMRAVGDYANQLTYPPTEKPIPFGTSVVYGGLGATLITAAFVVWTKQRKKK